MTPRNWPINRKYLAGTLAVTLPAIAFISLFLIIAEQRSVQAARLANTQAFIGMIAANAATSVLFDDKEVANQILSGITAEPSAEVAALYDAKGELYAWFPTNIAKSVLPPRGEPARMTVTSDRLEAFADVIYSGRHAGSAYLRINLTAMNQRFRVYVFTVLGVATSAVLMVLVLAKLLQRWIVQPLLALSTTARKITAEGNFSLRAEKRGEDELGELVDSFNQMLVEIQRRGAALSASEQRFRELAENIPQLAWMTDEKGWIFWYNQRWFDYTGMNLEQMQGWGWQTVHHPQHVAHVLESWKRSLAAGQPWEDTFPLRRKDGEYRWFLSRAYPIRDEDGKIMRWFGTNTDVTELRDTQEALRSAQSELEGQKQKLEITVQERTAKLRETVGELEAFSYSIAHDMRAPLRSMRGFSGLLSTDYREKLDATAQDYLRRIANSSERLDALIQDVLNYSKVVRGELKTETVDVAKLTREILESYPNLQPPNAEVIVQGPLPSVRANPAALTQIISNMLGNAAKFVAKGTKPRVIVRAEEFDGFVRLWFEDNGIGIEPHSQTRLFQMFQRVHRPELYEGTGIGLAIVRKAVERMGGRVGVESEVDKGSRFWVELPRAATR